MEWIPTTTPPDGSRTEFSFALPPIFVSYNGLNCFEGENPGYETVGVNTVRLLDYLGNVITPATGDSVRAEVA